MAFEKLKENTEQIQDNAKALFDTNVAYYKLWFFKVAMKSTTMILKIFLLSIFLMLMVLFLSIAGAFALGNMLGSYALGFLIVGLIYLILCIVVYYIKDKIVEGPILEKFSEFFFND